MSQPWTREELQQMYDTQALHREQRPILLGRWSPEDDDLPDKEPEELATASPDEEG